MSETIDYPMLIGGSECHADQGEWINSEFPFTREVWARIPRGTDTDGKAAVTAAAAALNDPAWGGLTPSARGKLLYKLADVLERNADRLADLEVMDNGKRIGEMRSQLKRIPDWYRYFAGLADKVQGAVLPNENQAILNITEYQPVGVVVAITPWNSPLLLAAYKLAPALAAGNTIVLKPSEFTSCSSIEFGRLFSEAGFPPGVVNVVTGYGHEIGAALVSDPRIGKVTFTGGNEGGRAVYKLAAEQFTDVALELGGKSPNIVFPDADIENAVNGQMGGIFAATGQTCVAGSRLFLHENIAAEFQDRIVEKANTLRYGDPRNPSTQMGPVATEAQFNKILDYIESAKADGATCVAGGAAADHPDCGGGLFIQPTIFTNVTKDMRIAREEIFGPVLCVMTFQDEDEVVARANDTEFGLAAGLWTRDLQRAIRVSRKLDAGMVWVNTYRAVSYTAPFGGVKKSGIGRENGIEAIREFLDVKCTWFNSANNVADPFA